MTYRFMILIIGFCAAATAAGQEAEGFLSDYSKLESREADLLDRVYLAPNAAERFADYDSIAVDQPEIFIAPDSKYKGAKGDQLKLLADTIRLATMERLEAGGYTIADEPGPGVLYLRFAVVDLYLKKKKRGLLSYTPVGFVVHSTVQAAVRDLWKKIDIVELGIEMELLDSGTGEVLAAATSAQGQRKAKGQEQDLVSWEELDALFRTVGERIRCRLDNAHTDSPEEQMECSEIWIEPEQAASR